MSPERKLERQLVALCKERGYYCRKFVSPGHRGVPDRIVITSKRALFIELKSPGETPDPLQRRELELIAEMYNSGVRARWFDNWQDLLDCLNAHS